MNPCPKISFGTYQLRGDDGQKAIEQALKIGYRCLDTAQLYRNEAKIGELLTRMDLPRKDLFLTTKIHWGEIRNGSKAIIKSLTKSLADLKTSYVDLLLLHAPLKEKSRNVEAWTTLLQLQKDGLCRFIGVSNYDTEDLQSLYDATKVYPAVNQIEVTPFHPQIQLVDYCHQHQIQVQAHSILSQGLMLDYPPLRILAEEYNGTVAQVLFKWALQKGYGILQRTANEKELNLNKAVVDLPDLTDSQMVRIDSIPERLSLYSTEGRS